MECRTKYGMPYEFQPTEDDIMNAIDQKKEGRKTCLKAIAFLALCLAALIGLTMIVFRTADAKAEVVAMGVLLSPGALVCDTLGQVMERIDSFKGEPFRPKGCGNTSRQIYARVIPETRFRSNGLIFILVRYEFAILKGNGAEVYVQYGHWGTPQPIKKEVST